MQFESWGVIEWPTALRKAPDLNKRYDGLNCEKGEVNMYGMEDAALIAEIHRLRRCTWYEPNADLPFAQLAKSRHDRHEFRRRVFLDRVVFAVIGAVLVAIATQVLAGFPF